MARASATYVTGLTETLRDLERFGADVEDLRQAFGEISSEIVEGARANIDDDTGALGATVRPVLAKSKAVVVAGEGLDYGGVINYGWPGHGIEAQGYLTGPANDDLDSKVARIEANLTDLIRRYDLN